MLLNNFNLDDFLFIQLLILKLFTGLPSVGVPSLRPAFPSLLSAESYYSGLWSLKDPLPLFPIFPHYLPSYGFSVDPSSFSNGEASAATAAGECFHTSFWQFQWKIYYKYSVLTSILMEDTDLFFSHSNCYKNYFSKNLTSFREVACYEWIKEQ